MVGVQNSTAQFVRMMCPEFLSPFQGWEIFLTFNPGRRFACPGLFSFGLTALWIWVMQHQLTLWFQKTRLNIVWSSEEGLGLSLCFSLAAGTARAGQSPC